MDFGLTDEQDQLAAAERAWLTRNDPIARVRATLDSAAVTVDPAAVAHAAESGLLALLTPEMGGTQVDLAVVTEEHGYAASSLPVADVSLATWLLDRVGIPRTESTLVGLALCENARVQDGTLQLAGSSSPVPMAADMASVAVTGVVDHREYLIVLTPPTTTALATLDLTRSWARLRLDVTTDDWTELPQGTVALLRDALAVHRAFDALGAAARLLDMTVSYAGQREQFGAPIGSFQAVKHHCADTAPAAARSRAASAAAAYTKSAAARVAGTALQVHGGIGFTWEHDLHLFLRRIKVDEAFNGSVAEHRAAVLTA
jgi:alkylation response protein AidB-like acyl-CoA dehydrogenase